MSRNASGLEEAQGKIATLREEYWNNVNVPGSGDDLNQSLEVAGRVADFFELGELMCRDALERDESRGVHYRTDHPEVSEDWRAHSVQRPVLEDGRVRSVEFERDPLLEAAPAS